MCSRSSRFLSALLPLLTLLATSELAAQGTGAIQGRVLDAESGEPLSTAMIVARNDAGRDVGSAITNREGRFRLEVPAGRLRVTVSAVGYGTTELDPIQVAEGATESIEYRISRQAYELTPMVVSVGRRYEKAIQAPAHVEIVSETDIRSRPAVTPVDHLRAVPGIDVITQGVQSTNVVVRGFNNVFSGALHTLTDNRIASVPSLRVNVMHFVPSTDDDIERMEVVLGPGAALYGPNTANGVLHMITRSPLDEEQTTGSLMGGEQDLFGGSFRTSHRLSPDVGVKVSGQFLRAREWEHRDPVELAEREKFESNMDFWREDLMRAAGIDEEQANRRISRIAARDFDVERWNGELRADWAISDEATAVFSAGRATAGKQIELTGLGAAQANDWTYSYYQTRLNWGRFFGQVYLNQSDAGDTFLLRNGAPIVDRSKVVVAQLQNQSELGARQRFTYGVDLIHTDPETERTINGIYEDDDQTTEVGAYVQSETQISPRFDLVLAGRVDEHSALPDPVVSPRAAVVFRPSQEQAVRLTYNRAFSTPSSLNQFLDLGTAIPNAQLARLGFSVRVQGTGTDGFRFGEPGSYQMRSPFTPSAAGGPEQLLPAANAAGFWPAVVQVVAQQAQQSGQPLDPQLVQYLLGLEPSAGDIGANFFNTVTGDTGELSALQLPDVDPIRESIQNTLELGYKGVLGERAVVAADVWHSRRSDLVTPLTVQTPLVTLNGQEVGAYLVPRLMELGMSQQQATELAGALAQGMAQVPVGVISSPDVNANGAQLLATYTNVDETIDLWGLDLSLRILLSNVWSLRASASFVNDDHFRTDRQLVTLNAPSSKGSLGVTYRSESRGLDAGLRARFQDGFPASSGVYEGLACLAGAPSATDPCVEGYTLLDGHLSYRMPFAEGLTAQLSVQNLTDESYRSFPGVPDVGRMALLRLRYDL